MKKKSKEEKYMSEEASMVQRSKEVSRGITQRLGSKVGRMETTMITSKRREDQMEED